MNERIKELAEQANVLHTEFFDNEWEVKKFAELIVKECCDIVHSKTDESIRVVMAIEQHFGVD